MQQRGPALEFDHVEYAYGRSNPCLRGLTFRLPKGEKLCIMGANGSGKSTVARLSAGLIRPTSGTVRAAPAAYVAQDPEANIVGETVADDVGFALAAQRLAPAEIERRTRAALAAVGMAREGARPMSSLSGGEVQRVAVASALAMGAELLVMDEPTSHLPRDEAKEFWRALADGSKGGPAVLFTTHDPAEAAFADWVALLGRGAVAAWGRPWALLPRARLLDLLGINPEGLFAAAGALEKAGGRAMWPLDPERLVDEVCSRLTG